MSKTSILSKLVTAAALTLVAGAPSGFGSANTSVGPATNARFYLPQGVVMDGAGTIYVADTLNCVIRKITSAGAVMSSLTS